ncbi:NADH-ubiquinone oxidoreductase chain 2, partial [Cucurbita argyrosperma subsp. sororia]
MRIHVSKDRVEFDTANVYSISVYESTITTRDEPWFGELKLASASSSWTVRSAIEESLRILLAPKAIDGISGPNDPQCCVNSLQYSL